MMKVFNVSENDFTIQGEEIAASESYAVPTGVQVLWAKDPALRASMVSGVALVGWMDASGAEAQFGGEQGMDMLRSLAAGTMAVQDQTGE